MFAGMSTNACELYIVPIRAGGRPVRPPAGVTFINSLYTSRRRPVGRSTLTHPPFPISQGSRTCLLQSTRRDSESTKVTRKSMPDWRVNDLESSTIRTRSLRSRHWTRRSGTLKRSGWCASWTEGLYLCCASYIYSHVRMFHSTPLQLALITSYRP